MYKTDVLEKLYSEADSSGIPVKEWRAFNGKAASVAQNGVYWIFLNRRQIDGKAEEKCILAHELGHCKTGATHRLSSPLDLIEKHERLADKYAVSRLISKTALRKAEESGFVEIWQLAEYFDVTEDFIRTAISVYSLSSE